MMHASSANRTERERRWVGQFMLPVCLRSLASRSAKPQPTAVPPLFSTRKIRTDAAARLHRSLSPGPQKFRENHNFVYTHEPCFGIA